MTADVGDSVDFPDRLTATDPLVADRDRQIEALEWECRRLRAELAHEKNDVIALNWTISQLEEVNLLLEADLTVAVQRAFIQHHVLRAIRPLVGVPDDTDDTPTPGQPSRPPLTLTWFTGLPPLEVTW